MYCEDGAYYPRSKYYEKYYLSRNTQTPLEKHAEAMKRLNASENESSCLLKVFFCSIATDKAAKQAKYKSRSRTLKNLLKHNLVVNLVLRLLHHCLKILNFKKITYLHFLFFWHYFVTLEVWPVINSQYLLVNTKTKF